jgi:hypothetical protein
MKRVKKWIYNLVKETMLSFIKSNDLEKVGEKDITERIASWNWEVGRTSRLGDVFLSHTVDKRLKTNSTVSRKSTYHINKNHAALDLLEVPS